MVANYKEAKIVEIFFTCLKKAAYIWHSVKLTQLKKKLMRTASIIQIGRGLIARFKKRGSVALAAIQTKKYGFTEVKTKTPRAYA